MAARMYIVVKKGTIDDYKAQIDLYINRNQIEEIEIQQITEGEWKELDDKTDKKFIFMGNFKDVALDKRNTTYRFEKYGVRLGWSGDDNLYVDISEKMILDRTVYMDFLSEFSSYDLVDESLKAGWSDGLFQDGNPKLRKKLPLVQTFVVPFGFVKTIKDDATDSIFARRQLAMYGIVAFCENILRDFIDAENM